MHRFRIARLQLVAFEHVEHLQQQHAAGGRRRHRHDVKPAVAAAQRGALDHAIVLQIVGRHQPAGRADRSGDLLGDRPFVEGARPVARDGIKRARQIALHQAVAAPERLAVAAQKNLRGGGPAREHRLRVRQRVGEIVVDQDAVARHHDGRRDQVAELEFPRAILLMRQRQARHSAGHADRGAELAQLFHVGLAALVEISVWLGRGRRGLAIVDRKLLIAFGEMDQHEAAAADVAGARIGNGHRKADRDRGVDRVAAALEHLDADPRGAFFLRHHHAVACSDRSNARQFGSACATLGVGGRDDAEHQQGAHGHGAINHSRHGASLSEALPGWYRFGPQPRTCGRNDHVDSA